MEASNFLWYHKKMIYECWLNNILYDRSIFVSKAINKIIFGNKIYYVLKLDEIIINFRCRRDFSITNLFRPWTVLLFTIKLTITIHYFENYFKFALYCNSNTLFHLKIFIYVKIIFVVWKSIWYFAKQVCYEDFWYWYYFFGFKFNQLKLSKLFLFFSNFRWMTKTIAYYM